MIRNYFRPSPQWPIWLIVLGVIVLIIGLAIGKSTAVALVFVGLVMAGLGILGIVTSSKGKATDQQMDEWLQSDRKEVEKLALNRLGTVEGQLIKEPLTIYEPIFWNTPGLHPDEVKMKQGKDGLLRFSAWSFTVLHLTDKFMGSFQTTLNFLNGRTAGNEHTEEFFYRDITKVGTAKETLLLADGSKFTDAEKFSVKVSSGDSIDVVDPTLRWESMGKKTVPTTSLEQTVQAIRTVLRDKKS